MLRTRLLLSLLPFVILLLATGGYAIVLFSRLTSSVDTAVAENYRSVVTGQRMLLALGELDREAWASAGTGGGLSVAFQERQARFEADLALQLGNSSLPGAKDLNQELSANYAAFTAALARLASPQNADDKHRFYEREVVPPVLRMKVALNKIVDLNQQAILSTGRSIRDITSRVTRLMILGMVVAVAVSVAVSIQIGRSVLRPLQLVTRATRELGEGNLEQQVPVVSRDELGELALAFNRMAGQLREYRQSTTDQILRLHRTMETTLASFPDPIFVLNKEGRIDLSNPAAAELAAGMGWPGVLPERLQAIAQKTLASGTHFLPHSFNAVISYRLNGEEKFYLPRVLTMRDKQEVLFGVAVVLYDVTRFRLLDAAKTNLVATVSHELKSPLTSVRMALHLLLERTVGALTPRQDELVQTARNDSERLLRILNDLLDLARLEGGDAGLHRETVAPAELVGTMVEEASDAAATRGLVLTSRIAPDLPPVSVDRQRIGHVFSNLLSNAVKHSPAGGEIVVRVERAEDGGVRFSMIDHGPGVPEEFQARIFERFFRVPGQTRKGAGLGLSIAREITLAHGGRIGVKSIPGSGAEFFVVLEAAG